jgi:hypothetical protein
MTNWEGKTFAENAQFPAVIAPILQLASRNMIPGLFISHNSQ